MNKYCLLGCVYAFAMQVALPTGKHKNPYPLHTAVSQDQVDTVQMLLQHPSGKFDINGRDKEGNTPLHIAAKDNAPACLGVLLAGGTINSKPNNDTESQEDEFYPKKGARILMVDLAAKNKKGDTALEVALITAYTLYEDNWAPAYAAIIKRLLVHKVKQPSAEWLRHHDSYCANILAQCQKAVQCQAVSQRQEAVVQCQKRGSIAKTSLCVML